MNIIVQETKTASGKRILPMKAEVEECFKSIILERTAGLKGDGNVIQLEQTVGGYCGFLFLDDAGLPLVAMHWEHRLSHMVNRNNSIYKVQMPKITPHVCRHTYCSNMARKGMNPKTLQYNLVPRVCPHVGHGGGCGGTGGNSLDWVERAARGADLWQGTRASAVISHRLFLIGKIALHIFHL